MRFSIIVPIYNVEAYIKKCLNSILFQTFLDFEIILVDDGSRDKSGTICDEYAKNDARIKVIHKENGGLSSARNVGLESARGEYILFIDSDDFWQIDSFLEEMNKMIENNENKLDMIIFPFSYYFSDSKIIRYTFDNNIILSGDFRDDFIRLIENNIYTASACNKCIKRSILIDNEILFPIDRLSEDILWCAELSSFIEKYEVYYYPVYAYRQNRINSLTYRISKKNIYDILKSIDDIYISSRFKRQEDTIFSKAILTYLSKCFLDIIPYVGNLYHDSDIKYFIDKYLFLLKYSKNIKGGKRIIQFCVKFFGLRVSLFILFYLIKLYKLIRF